MKLLISMVTFSVATLIAYGNPQNAAAKNAGAPQSASSTQPSGPDAVVTHYLHLKNALATDDSKEAAATSSELQKALVALGKEAMNTAQKKAYADIAGDAGEHAEHISENAGNIKHQREHFQGLSENIYDLVKAFGASTILYKDYCPMAKAMWLSEIRDIKNPYYGKSMSTCGQVKETMKP